MDKYAINYAAHKPMSGVKLTGGRFKRAFENNIQFLKGFDIDRMLYWYRVHRGAAAPGAPYANDHGHFENNLKGQTASEFLMGACTSLLWCDDSQLRDTAAALLEEIALGRESDGFLLPITRQEFRTREYPNYTRAWLIFGLLDAGYAGFDEAFELARGFGDFFNQCEVLPYVKDMNLGFQGILANTRLYDSPVGVQADVQTAIQYYQEDWWLDQLIADDQTAIYQHPGNHPHSTLLTTLEGYLDLYRFTGDDKYLSAVKHALTMYESKWQHIGGGINMCENDTYWPGCNWLSPGHNYNELCSTNFWVLLNQRMHLLYPDEAHYVDEMENSLYNVLLAAQVRGEGYHYLNLLERSKDWRWLDRATCCAATGSRLCALLPQFLYSYGDDWISVDIYADSAATLPLNGGDVRISCQTGLPDSGNVTIKVIEAARPFMLKLRHPRWSLADGQSYYEYIHNVQAGSEFRLNFDMPYRTRLYTGGEEIPHAERWALTRGPLLYAAIGAPTPLRLKFDPNAPDEWFSLRPDGRLSLRGDSAHEYMPYLDIYDEPFSVYPIVEQ